MATTCQLHCSCKIPPLLLYFSPVLQFLLVGLPLCDQACADVCHSCLLCDPSRPDDGSPWCCVGRGQCTQENRTVTSIPKKPGDQSSCKTLHYCWLWTSFFNSFFNILYLSFPICKALLLFLNWNLSVWSAIKELFSCRDFMTSQTYRKYAL